MATEPMGAAERMGFEVWLRQNGFAALADKDETYRKPIERKIAPFGWHRASKYAKGRR